MAGPISFSRRFGWPLLPHKPAAEKRLTLSNTGEKRLDVIAALRGQLLAGTMDFRDDRVFPHDATLP